MTKRPATPSLEASCLSAMRFAIGREVDDATSYEKYQSLAVAVRTHLMDRCLETKKRYDEVDAKRSTTFHWNFSWAEPFKTPC